MNKTLIPVYPSCLSTLAHNDVTLCEILDKKGFQRMRSGNKRGYMLVELEAAEINSRRIAVSANLPF